MGEGRTFVPGRVTILDGGLSTALLERGVTLDPQLWTGGVLLDAPEELDEVARSFAAAGADWVTTATYQLSVSGLLGRGLTPTSAERTLASSARRLRAAVPAQVGIVGSIGPYGAHLGDGSEYRGDYEISSRAFADHYLPLVEALAPEVDVLAFETMPQLRELEAILDLLAGRPLPPVWVSSSLRDPETLADGTSLETVAHLLQSSPIVSVLGVNCCSPSWVERALEILGHAGDKPLLAYPNLGDHGPSAYLEERVPAQRDFDREQVRRWVELGATAIGGCCGAGPSAIAELSAMLE